MKREQNKFFIGAIVLLLFTVLNQNVVGQNAGSIRFNEILVHNEANAIDDFGEHTPWIELFNSSYNTVDIGGCYLTDDLNNPTKYWIPTGTPSTKVSSRYYIVFWADNHPTRGIFHLNFTLEEGKTIALFDANGRTLIDKVVIPIGQKPDITYGKPNTASNDWVFLDKSTPGADNDYSKKKSAGEVFVEYDPYGVGMTVIAMMVVFSALAILYVFYKTMGRHFMRKAKPKSVSALTQKEPELAKAEMSGELNAAIAMALYLYQSEMHDYENTVLTIQKVSRNYSPWSSKIYTLRKIPNSK